MEMFGYHGRALVIDLTTRDITWEPLEKDVLTRFVGGTGLATYLLYRHCPPGSPPLGPANPLVFTASPLVGSRLTTSNKFALAAKSPLTGLIGDSLSSSFFAVELKRLGCDALVLTGKCAGPTLLRLNGGEVEFIDAEDLMGLPTNEAEAVIRNRLGSRVRVASIGPAGERLVRFASIANDGGRQAGRAGLGAVMGSKNLKAIAVHGTREVPVWDPDGLRETGIDLARRSLGPATAKYREMGTIANMLVFSRLGSLPTRNFRQSSFEGAEEVSGERFHETHLAGTGRCAGCTIGCEQIVTTRDGGPESKGRLEYESSFALGPLVGVSSPDTVIRASHFCDRMGMDTISAGATVAWAMECFERGLLSTEDTGGVDLRFGNDEALMEALKMIAERRGLGDLLAEGTRRASTVVGRGSKQWAMHVKGMELPGYEPRSLKTMALGLAVSTRGACHNRSSAYEADFSASVDRTRADEARGRIAMDGEDYSAVLDSLIWCKFLRKAFSSMYAESAVIYEQVTGWPTTPDDLRMVGERTNNLKKLFNIREGWTRDDDTLPPRVLTERLSSGPAEEASLTSAELDMMIESYYRARGWTDDGLIPDSKLRELGLSDLVLEPAAY